MNIEERQAIEGRSLVLFDGLCAMCNGVVRFLIRRDAAHALVYAASESLLGQEMLAKIGSRATHAVNGSPAWRPDGIVFIESALTPNQRVSTKSAATIRILLLLPGGWPWLGRLVSCIPRILREGAYGLVARLRYRLFGAYKTCPIPSAQERRVILGASAASSD